MVPPRVRLSDLPEGASATFDEADVDPSTRRMLGSLGFTASCQLRLCKTGEPFIVRVRTTRIGLSKALAGAIYVIPEAANGSA
ncbi:MAG TPA: FeoA family protein [Vicinamibacterales bacterium]|nr:FeoA family protein [Vicinamibacterales bacterium]